MNLDYLELNKVLGIIAFTFLISDPSFSQDWIITDRMTLCQVEHAIKSYPPVFEHVEERLQIMESLDKIIDFSVADCNYATNQELAERMKEIVVFYRNRVDEGLDALEKTEVTEGVYVFKFYSSSVILKSAAGTVAVDFAQGPVGNDYKQGSVANEGEPETSDYFNTGFYLTLEQRDRLAKFVDVYLITHPHQDHADYSLAKRMIEAGKPVIGPEQLKYKWEDLSHGIIVPDYDNEQIFKSCEIFTQVGYQYSEIKDENGLRIAVPVRYLSRDVESIRYLIKAGGLIFIQAAETHTEGYEWLEKASKIGWNVEVLLRAGALQGARSVMKYLQDNEVQYFTLPIHEYEITHSDGGQRMTHLLKGNSRILFDQKSLMPLFWGESLHLTKQTILK